MTQSLADNGAESCSAAQHKPHNGEAELPAFGFVFRRQIAAKQTVPTSPLSVPVRDSSHWAEIVHL